MSDNFDRPISLGQMRRAVKRTGNENEKFLDLATEVSWSERKAFFELDALHNGELTDEDYYFSYLRCDLENDLEDGWDESEKQFVWLSDNQFVWWQRDNPKARFNPLDLDSLYCVNMPIPLGYFPDQLHDVWEYLKPMIEHVESSYWGPTPRFISEDCKLPAKYWSRFFEDYDHYATIAIRNEFIIFLLDQFGSLDALKQYLEAD